MTTTATAAARESAMPATQNPPLYIVPHGQLIARISLRETRYLEGPVSDENKCHVEARTASILLRPHFAEAGKAPLRLYFSTSADVKATAEALGRLLVEKNRNIVVE